MGKLIDLPGVTHDHNRLRRYFEGPKLLSAIHDHHSDLAGGQARNNRLDDRSATRVHTVPDTGVSSARPEMDGTNWGPCTQTPLFFNVPRRRA